MLMKLHKQKLKGLGKNEKWRLVKKDCGGVLASFIFV